MIAVDTNLLVYAHREDSPWYNQAFERILALAEGRASWAIPWPCLHEFLAIVTHPRIYNPPTPLTLALDQVEAWLDAPTLSTLSESEGYWPEFRASVKKGMVMGPQIHDARVVALCRLHGVREIWTADRDFNRFPGIAVRNPLVT